MISKTEVGSTLWIIAVIIHHFMKRPLVRFWVVRVFLLFEWTGNLVTLAHFWHFDIMLINWVGSLTNTRNYYWQAQFNFFTIPLFIRTFTSEQLVCIFYTRVIFRKVKVKTWLITRFRRRLLLLNLGWLLEVLRLIHTQVNWGHVVNILIRLERDTTHCELQTFISLHIFLLFTIITEFQIVHWWVIYWFW